MQFLPPTICKTNIFDRRFSLLLFHSMAYQQFQSREAICSNENFQLGLVWDVAFTLSHSRTGVSQMQLNSRVELSMACIPMCVSDIILEVQKPWRNEICKLHGRWLMPSEQ